MMVTWIGCSQEVDKGDEMEVILAENGPMRFIFLAAKAETIKLIRNLDGRTKSCQLRVYPASGAAGGEDTKRNSVFGKVWLFKLV